MDILKFKRYDVKGVNSGDQAVDAVKKEKFDVVFMDVNMPEKNGIETVKLLRQIDPEIKVIMITAFADEDVYKEILRNGKFKVIQKPVDIDKFLGMLEKMQR